MKASERLLQRYANDLYWVWTTQVVGSADKDPKAVTMAQLWDLDHYAHRKRHYDKDAPIYGHIESDRPSVDLYPEGLNDSTKATALKAAWRRVIARLEADA